MICIPVHRVRDSQIITILKINNNNNNREEGTYDSREAPGEGDDVRHAMAVVDLWIVLLNDTVFFVLHRAAVIVPPRMDNGQNSS